MPRSCFPLRLPGCFRIPSASNSSKAVAAVPYEILGYGDDQSISTGETLNSPKNQLTGVPDSVREIPGDSVAVTAYSTEPYVEFRQSIMEMVEFRLEQKRVVNWDYLEVLLSCYLELNDKKCHEHIVTAYVSVLVELCTIRSLD